MRKIAEWVGSHIIDIIEWYAWYLVILIVVMVGLLIWSYFEGKKK